MKKYLTIFTALFLFICVPSAYADTHAAASCSVIDVTSAITAASDGDTVTIPSGTCSWATSVSIPSSKGITLQGAGIGSTIIQDGTGAYSNVLRVYTATASQPVRVTAIEFDAQATVKSGLYSQIYVSGDAPDFRIDNCKFDDMKSRGIIAHAGGNELYGLIDHCEFVAPYAAGVQGVTTLGEGPESGIQWTRAYTPGTANAIYTEDCTFTYSYLNDGATDNYGGARYVFRNNIVNGTMMGGHHGADSGGYYSGHTAEYYNNVMTSDEYRGIYYRGGTGFIFNNTFTGTISRPIDTSNYCTCYGISSCSSYWGQCDTYPCTQQVGRTTGEVLAPLYTWNNTETAGEVDIDVYNFSGCSSPSVYDHIQEERDIYDKNLSFDGTAGIGVGVIGSIPGTCTTGVAYWATDEGEWDSTNGATPDGRLYKCTATDTWTLNYTPYTYPHPLASGVADETAPVTSGAGPSTEQSCTSNPRAVVIYQNTDENSTCKYSEDGDGGDDENTAYADLNNTFTTTGGTSHSETIASLACESTTTYWTRCCDDEGTPNCQSSSTEITFSIAAEPPPPVEGFVGATCTGSGSGGSSIN